jgi:hypothetical protein
LFILIPNGIVLSSRGDTSVSRKGIEALKIWAQGEKLAPLTAEEYLWTGIVCNECGMAPLIGQRYRCRTCDDYDLCSACKKKGHKHRLKKDIL